VTVLIYPSTYSEFQGHFQSLLKTNYINRQIPSSFEILRKEAKHALRTTTRWSAEEILSWANHELSIETAMHVTFHAALFVQHVANPDAHGKEAWSVSGGDKDAVIPATVGVDIGCGMMAVRHHLSGILDGKLKDLRLAIEEAIQLDLMRIRNL
jgi:hypothetical protein